jgi:hypothetical protein
MEHSSSIKYMQHLGQIIPRQTYGKVALGRWFKGITAARVGTVDMIKRKTSLVMIHIMIRLNLGSHNTVLSRQRMATVRPT